MKKIRGHRIQLNAALLMLGGLALFVGVAWNSLRTMTVMERATDLRAQARGGLLLSSTVLSALKDVETGQRGFILTGDPAYLGPYEAGQVESVEALAALDKALVPFPAIAASLEGLDPMVTRRLEMARRNVAIRETAGFDVARDKIMSAEGLVLMDAIRVRFAVLDRQLQQEISERNRQVAQLMQRTRWAAGLLTLVGVVLIVAAYMTLFYEQRRRLQTEQALQDANANLEGAVATRTVELEQARREIEAFALRLDRGIEAERRRLAREVHDQLGQVFTALKMILNHGMANLPGNAERIERMNGLLSEGIATARRIAAELRPPLLDDMGLGPALTHRAARFAEESGIACETAVDDGESLDAEQATQIYRIVQEALTNVVRHAGARRVSIDGATNDDEFRLSVEDDGRGMLTSGEASLGLLSMRERAALAGGRLELGPGRTGGLRVTVRLPLRHGKEERDARPDH